MSKQPVRGVDIERIDEDSIADYLQRNPDFFDRHASLLTRLKLSHNRGAATVSLIERQVVALREKSQTLEARLRELIDVARSNDVLSEKIHKVASGSSEHELRRRSWTGWKPLYAKTSARPSG